MNIPGIGKEEHIIFRSDLNLILYAIVCLVIFCIVAYKMVYVPITHDETATTVHYSNYTIWHIMMYPDNWPNNHILNTLLTKFMISVFGKEQWAVRLPNLLFLNLYFFGVYRISMIFFKKGSVYLIATAALFYSNAYLLDFFGLCRGYGMAVALCLVSSSYLLSGFQKDKNHHIWGAFFLAILASYANFTLLIFWAAVTLLCLIYFIQKNGSELSLTLRPAFGLTICTFFYIALIYTPLYKMTTSGQFEYWTRKGFYEDTIKSLAENWRYNADLPFGINDNVISIAVIIAIVLGVLILLKEFCKKDGARRRISTPFTLTLLLICLPAGMSILQSLVLGTPNLHGRTALFFYPLFSILLVALFSQLQTIRLSKMKYFFSYGIALFGFWHLANTFNPKNVREWWYDENTFDVLDYLEKEHYTGTKPLKLNVNWLFHRSFFFYSDTGKTPWLELYPYSKDIEPMTNARYYYVLESDLNMLDSKFVKVQKFGWDRWLLRKVK